MKKLLLATAAAMALSIASAQAAIVNVGINPTSQTGNFSFQPGAGSFEDQVIFTLSGTAPLFVTIANATNTFAGPGDMIQDWTASIYDDGLDNIVNNADDNLLFGPQAATACILVPNCQAVGGSGFFAAGTYYAEFTGIGSGTSGYSGNISTFAVPGPIVGAGLPGLIAGALAFLGWRRNRRQAVA
jgi:hypothetical protein